jgi:hypothetical protein
VAIRALQVTVNNAYFDLRCNYYGIYYWSYTVQLMLVLTAQAVAHSSAAVYLQSADLQCVEALVPLTATQLSLYACLSNDLYH